MCVYLQMHGEMSSLSNTLSASDKSKGERQSQETKCSAPGFMMTSPYNPQTSWGYIPTV